MNEVIIIIDLRKEYKMTSKQVKSQLAIVLEEVKTPQPGEPAVNALGKPPSPINSTGNLKSSKKDMNKLLDDLEGELGVPKDKSSDKQVAFASDIDEDLVPKNIRKLLPGLVHGEDITQEEK